MEQYISKDALVAEIERRMKLRYDSYKTYNSLSDFVAWEELEYFKEEFLPTLEVKEVDVDKEINEHAEYMPQSEFSHDSEVLENIEWAKNEFRYFFELGMSVSKK